MKTKTNTAKVLCLLALTVILSLGCEKKVTVPPEQVDAEIAKAHASYEAFMKYNPPDALTYNYRNLISQAEQAKAKGSYEQAIALAKQADEQAVYGLQAWKDQIAKSRQKIDSCKQQIELLFPVNQNFVNKYWALEARYKNNDFQGLEQEVDLLLSDIDKAQKMGYVSDRSLRINPPQEYTKQWGDVRVYQEVTPDGKLKTVVDTVPAGAKVKVIKVMLFNPQATFYFVEVPITSKQGWVSEKYLSVGGSGNY
jgi:hypothetical protein